MKVNENYLIQVPSKSFQATAARCAPKRKVILSFSTGKREVLREYGHISFMSSKIST
jgi:hypothetical protein